MEAHENYNRQHQDIRTENGIEYGDVISGVNFDYAKKLTAVNAINLASLGWSPEEPKNVKIGGAVKPSTKLKWEKPKNSKILGYKIFLTINILKCTKSQKVPSKKVKSVFFYNFSYFNKKFRKGFKNSKILCFCTLAFCYLYIVTSEKSQKTPKK